MKRQAEWFAIAAFSLLVLYLFWPFLAANKIVGYRDAIQFYWPMWEWADRVWAAGEIPWWNPYDGLGKSFVSDGVSAVFYPGKLVFWLRGLSIETRMGLYLAGHIWMAGIGASRLARTLSAPRWASSLAMFSYGLSGPVLFQATNATFLVGAAWLPWGLIAVASYFRYGCSRGPAGVAFVAAMMILGGDIQMAYHLLLITAVVWLWPTTTATPLQVPTSQKWLAVATAGLLSIALSAIQFVPTVAAALESDRGKLSEVINVWKLPFAEDKRIGLWGEPKWNSHHGDIYEFSQPPWTLAGLFCPNVFGSPFPVRTDWASGFPSAGGSWQPSLYQSLIPILCLFWSRKPNRKKWLGCTTIIFGLGALGWYGPVWLLNEVGLASGLWKPITDIGRPVGGVYWAMVSFAPGYDLFRYPAKLWIVTTLGISVLGAIGLPRFVASQWATRVLGAGSIAMIILWLLTWIVDIRGWLPLDPGDDWFGPLDANGARRAIQISFLHASVVMGTLSLLIFCLRNAKRAREKRPRAAALAQMVISILFAADLAVANSWLIPAIDRPNAAIENSVELGNPWPMESSKPPDEWRDFSSQQRLNAVAAWQIRSSLFRMNLLNETRRVYVPGTLQDSSWQAFVSALAVSKPSPGAAFGLEDLKGSRGPWLLLNASRTVPDPTEESMEANLQNFYSGAIADGISGEPAGLEGTGPTRVELRPRNYSRSRQVIGIEVQLPEAGVLVLQDSYSPGWRANIERDNGQESEKFSQECIPVGGVFRGLVLPAGDYRIEFLYRPQEIVWGIFVTLISWCLFAIVWSLWIWNVQRNSIAKALLVLVRAISLKSTRQ